MSNMEERKLYVLEVLEAAPQLTQGVVQKMVKQKFGKCAPFAWVTTQIKEARAKAGLPYQSKGPRLKAPTIKPEDVKARRQWVADMAKRHRSWSPNRIIHACKRRFGIGIDTNAAYRLIAEARGEHVKAPRAKRAGAIAAPRAKAARYGMTADTDQEDREEILKEMVNALKVAAEALNTDELTITISKGEARWTLTKKVEESGATPL